MGHGTWDMDGLVAGPPAELLAGEVEYESLAPVERAAQALVTLGQLQGQGQGHSQRMHAADLDGLGLALARPGHLDGWPARWWPGWPR